MTALHAVLPNPAAGRYARRRTLRESRRSMSPNAEFAHRQPLRLQLPLPAGGTGVVYRHAGFHDASTGARIGRTARAGRPPITSAGRRRCSSSEKKAGRWSPTGIRRSSCSRSPNGSRKGVPVRIVGESDWLRLVGLDGRCREVHSLYTPAMLCQSLNVPIGTIRRWERLGLIRPVRKVYRLPYFDYSEAAGRPPFERALGSGNSPAPVGIQPDEAADDAARASTVRWRSSICWRRTRGCWCATRTGLSSRPPGQRCFDFVPPAPPGEPPALEEVRSPVDRDDATASWPLASADVQPPIGTLTGRPTNGSRKAAGCSTSTTQRARSRHFGRHS